MMNTYSGLRFLRPYLCNDVVASRRTAYVRFFNTTHRLADQPADDSNYPIEAMVPFQVRQRVTELKKAGLLKWPRIQREPGYDTIKTHTGNHLNNSNSKQKDYTTRTMCGRVRTIRKSGRGLVFINVEQDRYYGQIALNYNSLDTFSGITKTAFTESLRCIKRGDIISVTGTLYTSKSGLMSLSALELPKILSPSLEVLPFTIKDPEMKIRNRHVNFLVNSAAFNLVKSRSRIIQHIRDFLIKDDFMEVQTPILADKAGGAVAKPFITNATEFPEKQLALRIAPELWLKRLIMSGMDRVFEIGPAFRNEGLDATHNPEFTTCEFYKSYAELEDLINMTEEMISSLAAILIDLQKTLIKTLPEHDLSLFTGPFKRISFIPAVEEGLGQKLPDLKSPTAEEDMIAIFKAHDIPLPSSPTLPRLLDKLCSIYIEPSCVAPTFITFHPACMAPLSKSFLDEKTNQYVSARAELFVENKELANMYEEENSPFEQRKKFLEQVKWRDDENSAVVDESYIEALEWGMPPTGGWGMGIDRLVMLMTSANRISDVLAFGSLRNVVNLSNPVTAKTKVVGVELEGEMTAEMKQGEKPL